MIKIAKTINQFKILSFLEGWDSLLSNIKKIELINDSTIKLEDDKTSCYINYDQKNKEFLVLDSKFNICWREGEKYEKEKK